MAVDRGKARQDFACEELKRLSCLSGSGKFPPCGSSGGLQVRAAGVDCSGNV